MPVDTPSLRAALQFLIAVLLLAVFAGAATAGQTADRVLVIKSKERLYLIRNDEVFASYHVVFGANPKGHKQQQGDERTPEGHYTLGYKNAHSSFYKSIHISYPNREDRIRARERGVSPGGDIMIHGQANGWEWISPLSRFFNWTDGCIALSNRDMDAVWEAVPSGTPIEIRP
jgi:murein L,D-transpeptidase YafK